MFLSEILFPVPFQPVLTRYAFAPCSFIFPISVLEYLVGCKVKNASPNAGENDGSGAVIPLSVPANLEVYPQRKWYCA
ncbi:hypothetical protein D3C87_1486050 [compost metagenome]